MVDSGAKKQKKGFWPGSNPLDIAVQMSIGEESYWDYVYLSAEKPIPIGTVKKTDPAHHSHVAGPGCGAPRASRPRPRPRVCLSQ